jgi:hypothetical protein
MCSFILAFYIQPLLPGGIHPYIDMKAYYSIYLAQEVGRLDAHVLVVCVKP